jgi:hypothetical protein
VFYKDKFKRFSLLPPRRGGGGDLRVTEDTVIYESRKQQINIAVNDLEKVTLVGTRDPSETTPWFSIRYREDGDVKTGYFASNTEYNAIMATLLAAMEP